MNYSKLFQVFLIILLLNGCSSTPRVAYKMALPTREVTGIVVAIDEFRDDRLGHEKLVLGDIKNGYGMSMASLEGYPELFDDVKQAFVNELKNSGYRINNRNADMSIKAYVKKVGCDFTSGNRSSAQVKVEYVVTHDGNQVINKIYQGEKSKWTMNTKCDESLNGALMDLFGQIVTDLNRYSNQKIQKSM